MFGRRGLYEILLAFFTIIVLVFAVIFFVYANTQSATLYAQAKRGTSSPNEAQQVKDALLACHRIDYLVEADMDEPCRAKEMLKGFEVTQLPLNNCEKKTWSFAKEGYSRSIPFYVPVAQASTGTKCLARIDVLA